MSIPGGWELAVIILILILLFGAKRIPNMMRGWGKTMIEVKKAIKDISKGDEE